MAQRDAPQAGAGVVEACQAGALGVGDAEFVELGRSGCVAVAGNVEHGLAVLFFQDLDDAAVVVRHPGGGIVVVVADRHGFAGGEVEEVVDVEGHLLVEDDVLAVDLDALLQRLVDG